MFFSFAVCLLMAMSFSIIYFPSKVFHIAHAVIIPLAAYLGYFFWLKTDLPLWVSLVAAFVIASLFGPLFEFVVYRRMRRIHMPQFAYFVVSLGLYLIVQNTISLSCGDEPISIKITHISESVSIGSASMSIMDAITIASFLLVALAARYLYSATLVGKSLRAIASNPELSRVCGMDTDRMISVAFVIGSSLAAFAGILLAMDGGVTPTSGFRLLLYGIVAMIIGGQGSTIGLVAGSLLVAISQNTAAYFADTKWTDATTFLVLIAFLIWKPLGFSGKLLRKVEI
jgi:branched-chain amino acid transport system permease protein